MIIGRAVFTLSSHILHSYSTYNIVDFTRSEACCHDRATPEVKCSNPNCLVHVRITTFNATPKISQRSIDTAAIALGLVQYRFSRPEN